MYCLNRHRISFVILVWLCALLSASAYAQEVLHPELYQEPLQKTILRKVLHFVNTPERVEVVMPKVFRAKDATPAQWRSICSYCRNIRINQYDPATNTVWLMDSADIAALAHEYTHFVQVKYYNATLDEGLDLETQAVSVQNQMRAVVVSIPVAASRE